MPKLETQIFLSACVVLACACETTERAAAELATCAREPRDARAFVVFPDTQFYACAYPAIFDAQTRFVAENAAAMGLGIAVHTGDIVDRDDDAQWSVAASALHMLDGQLPYLLAPGNHDLRNGRASLIDAYFMPADLGAGGCSEIGLKDAGRIENSYAVVPLRGEPWLFIGLEFGPRDAVLEWASEVLDAHAEMRAVLFTHAYLFADDERYDRAVQPMQPYHPDGYGFTPSEGIADGQDIWETLVEPHANVKLVLSGHVIPDGVARSRARRSDGSVVHELLANYQQCGACPCEEVEGGGGYLRIVELNEARDALQVTTHSPYLERSFTAADNSFVLAL
jgi:hypothetical protein